jgi:hypothetical protein
MINTTPFLKMKGRGASRVKVNGRSRAMKDKIDFIKEYYPAHYLRTGNVQYLSNEAYQTPIKFLIEQTTNQR